MNLHSIRIMPGHVTCLVIVWFVNVLGPHAHPHGELFLFFFSHLNDECCIPTIWHLLVDLKRSDSSLHFTDMNDSLIFIISFFLVYPLENERRLTMNFIRIFFPHLRSGARKKCI